MSNIPASPERNAPDPILPEPIGEDGFVQPREPDEQNETDQPAPAPSPERPDRP